MADVANVGPSAQSIPVPNSDWPPDMLYVHLSSRIEDLKSHLGDLRTSDLLALQAAFVAAEKSRDLALSAQEKAVQAALVAQEKAVQAALAAAEKATDKYEREVKEWRVASNEWRDAMNDRETRFVNADTFTSEMTGMSNQIENVRSTMEIAVADLRRSRDLAVGRQTAATALIGLIFAAITIALRFL